MSDNIHCYSSLPIEELLPSTRHVLSLYLNPLMDIPTAHGRLKDWRGVAESRGFAPIHIKNFELSRDPTGAMLDDWNSYNLHLKGRTTKTLIDILTELERADVLVRLQDCLRISWENWRTFQRMVWGPEQVNHVSSPSEPDTNYPDEQLLAVGDRLGEVKRTFDAFLCYADEDFKLAEEFTNQLEGPPHRLKIFFSDRDLRPGGSHCTILARTIRDRCKTVIFLATPASVSSQICDFMVRFAHYLSPGACDRSLMMIKIVNDVRVPEVLQPQYHLDYTTEHKRKYFWPKLIDYIVNAPPKIQFRCEGEPANLRLTLQQRRESGNEAAAEPCHEPTFSLPDVPRAQPTSVPFQTITGTRSFSESIIQGIQKLQDTAPAAGCGAGTSRSASQSGEPRSFELRRLDRHQSMDANAGSLMEIFIEEDEEDGRRQNRRNRGWTLLQPST